MQVANAINRFSDHAAQQARVDQESTSKAQAEENKRTNADRLFLNELRPDTVRTFLTERIIQRLQSMQDSMARFQQATPSYDDNDLVRNSASKIVNSANSAVEQLSPKAGNTSAIRMVKDAVAEEVKNTRRDFDNHYLNNEPTLKGLAKLEQALQEALSKYPFALNSAVQTETLRARSTSLNQSISSSIEIKTQDGDIVTINLQRSSSINTAEFAYSNSGTNAEGFATNVDKSFSLEFSVQGNLDEDELKSINKLLKNIESVADKFEYGSLNAALAKASKLKFDATEIASFSASFQSQKQYKAVELYQQTQAVHQQDAVPLTPQKIFSDLSDLLKDLEDLVVQATETTNLESPKDSVNGILEKMAKLKEETKGLDSLLSSDDGHLLSNFV